MIGTRASYATSDPKEAELRARWHATKGDPASHAEVHKELSDYLWDRAMRSIEEDRKKHPKAKRNQPVPSPVSGPPRRCLP